MAAVVEETGLDGEYIAAYFEHVNGARIPATICARL